MNRYILTPLLCLILAAGCTQEIKPEEIEPGILTVRASATVKLSGISFPWFASSDRIGVYARKSDSGEITVRNACLAAYSSTTTSLFKPLSDASRIELSDSDRLDLGLYYPFRTSCDKPESLPLSVPSEQTITPGREPSFKQDNIFTCTIPAVGAMESPLETELLPAAAYLRISISSSSPAYFSSFRLEGSRGSVLAFTEGSFDLFTGAIDSGEETYDTIGLSSETSVTVTSSPLEIYVKVNPGFSGDKLTFIGTMGKAELTLAEFEVPEGGFKSGECSLYDVRITGEFEMPGDLSKNGTANCYIVTEAASEYSFDATVKGNGSNGISWTFDGTPVNKDFQAAISPASAALLWYSNPEENESLSPVVASSVSFDPSSGRISFRTPESFVEGNAVIAAFDASGNILWSWNIWAVEGWDSQASAKTAGRYVFMDRNLGAVAGADADVSDVRTAAKAIGNYYQWGRKDPFPAARTYTDSYKVEEGWGLYAWTPLEAYKVSGNKIFSTDRTANGRMLGSTLGSGYTLEDAVEESARYPHKWMFSGNSDTVFPQYSWFTAEGQFEARTLLERMEWRYLWGSTDNVSNVKTVYDPCPPGWKVPTADAFVPVLNNVKPSDGGHGIISSGYGLYFPYGGQRKAGFGGSVIVSAEDIMVASASVAGSLYPIRASRSSSSAGSYGTCITSSNSYAGAGLQVRCVKEDVASVAAPHGRQTGHRAALMGDSITRTWRDRGRKEFFTENDYLNKGVDGTTTTNMLNRFYADIVSDDPQLVVITAGTNDLAQNDAWGSAWNQCNYVSREELLANVALMAAIAEDLCGEVIIGSICPSRDMWWKPDEWKAVYNGDWIAEKIVETNKLLKAWAETHGYAWADYHSALKDDEDNLKDEYCWVLGTNPDGSLNLDRVHPNADAFLIMESILKPLIDGKLFDPDEGKPGSGNIDDLDKEEWK